MASLNLQINYFEKPVVKWRVVRTPTASQKYSIHVYINLAPLETEANAKYVRETWTYVSRKYRPFLSIETLLVYHKRYSAIYIFSWNVNSFDSENV